MIPRALLLGLLLLGAAACERTQRAGPYVGGGIGATAR